ncbi:MAG: hypothetical protein OEV44_15040 [Spirochaetota bacterium]|nr:hypothetical protein [Spirochaetota bacterium]
MGKEVKYFNPSKETTEAAQQFVDALKNGKIEKNVLPNTSEEFDVEKASKSIHNFTHSDAFKSIIEL